MVNTNLFEGMEDILADVYFSELAPIDKQRKSYEFRLIGWQDTKSAGSGLNNYKIIESISLQDYPELSLFEGQLFNLHISMPTFKYALVKLLSYHKETKLLEKLYNDKKRIVVDLKFNRGYKSMTIEYIKIYEILSANTEKLIAVCPKIEESNDKKNKL